MHGKKSLILKYDNVQKSMKMSECYTDVRTHTHTHHNPDFGKIVMLLKG